MLTYYDDYSRLNIRTSLVREVYSLRILKEWTSKGIRFRDPWVSERKLRVTISPWGKPTLFGQ